MGRISTENGATLRRSSESLLPPLKRTGLYRYQVEILIVMYCMASSMAYTFYQNLLIHKVCIQMIKQTSGNLPQSEGHSVEAANQRCRNLSTDHHLEVDVQKVAAQYLLVLSLVKHIPAVLVTMLMGPWSDLHGRRLCILLPFVGNAVTYFGFILNELNPEWPPYYMVLAAIPAGLTGDSAAVMMGLFSTIKDTTGVDFVSVRIAIVDGVEEASRQVGRLVGAPLYTSYGNLTVFLTSCTIFIAGAIATCCLVVEESPSRSSSGGRHVPRWSLFKSKMADFFNLKNALSTLTVVTVVRKHNLRFRIVMLLLATFILQVAINGSQEIMFLYTRLVLHWDVIMFNYYVVFVYGFTAIGFLVVLPLSFRCLKVSDGAVGFVGHIGLICVHLGVALVTTSFSMYCVSSFWMIGGITFVATRSCLSKYVDSNEIGKIMAIFAILTVISCNAGQVLSTQVYVATITYNPGFYFYLAAAALTINLGIFGWIYQAARIQINEPVHRKEIET